MIGAARCRAGALAASLAAALSACGAVDRDATPDLLAGRDACLECGMIINELRFAAGFVDEEGTSHGFDDLGCLVRYNESGRWTDPVPAIWVASFDGHGWVRAAKAFFVRADSLLTPMGYGIVALEDSLEAVRLADGGSVVFRYGALSRQVDERRPGAANGAPIKE